jgi:hypothetical protein
MLTGTRLGDDLRLAESFCEEDLADSIVDLVRTGVPNMPAAPRFG